MDSPSPEYFAFSNHDLTDISVLCSISPQLELTGLGWTLDKLLLDPQLEKMMGLASAFFCLDPVVSVVTSLDNKCLFLVTHKSKDKELARLASETVSDHLFLANAIAAWDSLGARGCQARDIDIMEFCHQNLLSRCWGLGTR